MVFSDYQSQIGTNYSRDPIRSSELEAWVLTSDHFVKYSCDKKSYLVKIE